MNLLRVYFVGAGVCARGALAALCAALGVTLVHAASV